MNPKFFITTFGCQQNKADSERIASLYISQGMVQTDKIDEADTVVINTCMVRESAENRIYGLVNNLSKLKMERNVSQSGSKNPKQKSPRIVLTGCMVGMAVRDKSGKYLKNLRKKLPQVDEFLPIEEIGFENVPLRSDSFHGWVPISNGCNNFCTFCVVPFSRGREISRPPDEIIRECKSLAKSGYTKITLLGMNVNSYGADLILGENNVQVMRDTYKKYFGGDNPKNQKPSLIPAKKSGEETKAISSSDTLPGKKKFKPVYVKHLGRFRIPTLFPHLLKSVSAIEGIEHIDFMTSNPWDFSDELIDVIAANPKITRTLHFAVQSGSNSVLRRMNRWYTREEYLNLLDKIKKRVKGVEFSTDIIVGFCGETDEEFNETVDLVKKAGFFRAYISIYSDRPMTAAHKSFKDDVPFVVKKKRWQIIEDMINNPKNS